MYIFSSIRRSAFWIKDKLKGNPVGSHYKDIKFIFENYSDIRSSQLREKHLFSILCYAIKSTPFYSSVKGASISDFPVINKNIVRKNYDDFKSKDVKYGADCCFYTSGSTGAPFSVNVNKRKRDRNTADTIFFGELAGYNFGDKLYYFKIWNNVNRKSRFLKFTQNIVPQDVLELNDQAISRIIEELKRDKTPKALLAYSSVYDAMCFHLNQSNSKPITNNTKAAISQAEALSQSTKEGISYYFNTKAVARYSNNENGIIAQQMPEDEEFFINEASFFVELLDMDSDVPVPYGTPGRIVLTDLFNYCMPMIRYDTGDIGVLDEKYVLGHKRKVLKSVEGRKLDMIYDTKGSLVSSYIWFRNMWKYKEIKQFQVIQLDEKEYTLKVNVESPFEKEADLVKEYKEFLGQDAIINIEYVSELPLLASGKRKTTLNLYRKCD
ncbi:MAG: CoF synthetase [Bacteroidota bacterium]|nr:CoF synthetase [Bacteroidota bacterium]